MNFPLPKEDINERNWQRYVIFFLKRLKWNYENGGMPGDANDVQKVLDFLLNPKGK